MLDACLMVHGSWLMAHGSWLMAHGSWLATDLVEELQQQPAGEARVRRRLEVRVLALERVLDDLGQEIELAALGEELQLAEAHEARGDPRAHGARLAADALGALVGVPVPPDDLRSRRGRCRSRC